VCSVLKKRMSCFVLASLAAIVAPALAHCFHILLISLCNPLLLYSRALFPLLYGAY
jgi:hypothetical protein